MVKSRDGMLMTRAVMMGDGLGAYEEGQGGGGGRGGGD